MAKSIEQKVVDTLVNAMADNRFRPAEFSRIMATETFIPAHFDFMSLVSAYMHYLAAFHEYGFYPNGLENECRIASRIAPIMQEELINIAVAEGDM